MKSRVLTVYLLALAAIPVLPGRSSAAQDDAGMYAQLVEKVASSICTVKAVIRTESKTGGQSRDTESRLSLQGVVVDPEGLVLISNLPLSPTRLYEIMGYGEMTGQMGFKMTPVSFKVSFEREDKEYDAFLAATDSKLDVAFLKVEALGDRKLAAVDLASAAGVTVGQRVAAVSRMGKGYDHAPFFQTARINGEITKPRKAWMLEGSMSGYGLPVFTIGGELIGILTTVPGASKEDPDDDTMGMVMFMKMRSGGGMMSGGSFVIPASVVKGAADQAKERAVVVAAERARKKTEPPAAAPAKKPAVTVPGKAPGPVTAPKKPAKP